VTTTEREYLPCATKPPSSRLSAWSTVASATWR